MFTLITRMKIIIIDDDPTTRKVIAASVTRLGHVTIEARDGKHAWEMLWDNRDIGLVITDMMMPDMDGRELIQILRGNADFADLPVIIVSGISTEESVQDLLDFGNCQFLPKPVDTKALKASIMLAAKD